MSKMRAVQVHRPKAPFAKFPNPAPDRYGSKSRLAASATVTPSPGYEPVAQFDAAQNSYVSLPIDLGPATDQVFLLLFGTGIRGRSALAAVSTQIGRVAVETLYAGPQGQFAGLDQVNVRLPRSLAGSGEIDVSTSVDGKRSNVVRVNVK